MYSTWVTKLVLAISLAVMPLQGLAQTVTALLCQPHMVEHRQSANEGEHHHGMDAAAHAHDDGGKVSPHASDDGSAPNGHTDHFCCDMVASGLPATATSLPSRESTVLVVTPGAFHYLTFLELPQRPPLA